MTKAQNSEKSFGYDLSAATDRLPLSLQFAVVRSLFGGRIAEAWRDVLVNREYYLHGENPTANSDGRDDEVLKYSVGQPMGALSSFNSLAITHHLIVQLCHRKAYSLNLIEALWWEGYELVGDDVIIFDEKVALEYLSFMEKIGVPINLAKSVISRKKGIDFLKITGLNGVDVSAVSWKMFISQDTVSGRVASVFSLLSKDICTKNRVAWIKRILVNLHGPNAYAGSLLGLLAKFVNTPLLATDRFLSHIIKPDLTP